MRGTLSALIAALVWMVGPASAFDPGISSTGLPSAANYGSSLLRELQGVVSWKTLAQVEAVRQNSRMIPRFSGEILSLDKQQVRIQGFIFPLDTSANLHAHFLISAVPPSCPFCMPAGPEALVEIFARKSVGYSTEPVIIEGRLAVLRDDPTGVLYRMADAEFVGAGVRYSQPKPAMPAPVWSWPEPMTAGR